MTERGEGEVAMGPETGGSWRRPVASVLLATAVLLAPLTLVASWADDQVGDTDRYVETIRPLASDPAVQAALVERITQEVVDRLDVAGATRDALDALVDGGLGPRAEQALSIFAAPVTNQVRGFVEEQVGRLIRSEQFERAWIEANREAHTQVVAVLTGTGSVVAATDGAVQVNLAAIIEASRQRLLDRGFGLASRIPEVEAQFVVLESVDLTRAQGAFRLLDRVSTLLPWLSLGLFVAGVAVARRRRRAVVVGSLGVVASMVVLGLLLVLVRGLYLDGVPPEKLPPAAAAAIFDALVHFLRISLRWVAALFAAVALLAWLTGPGSRASGIRGLARRS